MIRFLHGLGLLLPFRWYGAFVIQLETALAETRRAIENAEIQVIAAEMWAMNCLDCPPAAAAPPPVWIPC